MSANNAESGAQNALINELKALRKEFDEYRTTPQPIGNGSLNYAVFSEFSGGPFTVPPGLTTSFNVIFAPIGSPFTFDGKPAINRNTLEDLYWSVKVDVNDEDHVIPYGAALAGPERLAIVSSHLDYYASGLSDTNGQMYMVMQVTNIDSATHNYWITGRMLIPRPALKPQ